MTTSLPPTFCLLGSFGFASNDIDIKEISIANKQIDILFAIIIKSRLKNSENYLSILPYSLTLVKN